MWLLVAMSCTGAGDGGDTESGGTPTLAIVSPEDGATFVEPADVTLEVEAKVDDKAVEAKQIAWTVGDWTGTGASATASGLHHGSYTVEVTAVVDGKTLTDSVSIEVTPAEGDTDTDADTDTDTDVSTYGGTLDADVTVDSSDYGSFDDHCSAPITFTVDGIGGIAGSGTCTVFDNDLPFTLEGRVQDGGVSGNLVMTDDSGTEYRTPFDGTGDVGTPMQATFDKTFSSADGSLRIAGSWNAAPQ